MTTDAQKATMLQKNLVYQLFADSKLQTYAVLDGASNPALLDRLYGEQPEFGCLYRGKLEPDIAECAPYLVKLEIDTPFTEWLTGNAWGNHWGVFAVADCDFRIMQRHLRKFNMIYDEESNRSLLFRYYDPRVLNVFLPTCDAGQIAEFFGPIKAYFAETNGGQNFARFYKDQLNIRTEIL